MADEKKIVTKKTAPKQAATTKKASTKKRASTVASTPKDVSTAKASGATKRKGVKPTAARTEPTPKKATTTSAATQKPAAKPIARTMDERSNALRQLVDVTQDQRLAMIRDAAYYKAEKRNFAPGHEAHDWMEAERDIDELLARAKALYGR